MQLKVFTAFSGYDSQCMALDRLHRHNPDFNYELVGWAEIDKYAIAAHNAVYPQWAERNYGDIAKIDWAQVPDFDLFTYSSPCQDFSQAGKQAGGTEGSGTRSSLLWECRRAILAKKPKYLLMENVAALVSQKFIRLFNAWQLELESYGYRNFAKVLNAKDYGVPQNRERIFMVSVLDEQARYEFPEPMPLPLRLKDVLEPKVDERYYLKGTSIEGLNVQEPTVGAFRGRNPENPSERARSNGRYKQRLEMNENGTSNTLTGVQKDNMVVEPIVLGWVRDEKGNVVKRPPVQVANTVTSGKRDNTQNYVVEPINTDQDGNASTITAGYYKYGSKTLLGGEYGTSGTAIKEVIELPIDKKHQQDAVQHEEGISRCLVVGCHGNSDNFTRTAVSTEQGYRIRKLTERECFRLMDVPEEYIDRIQAAGISRSQQYKMAGNSIVVSCMYHIWRKLWIDTQIKTLTLF